MSQLSNQLLADRMRDAARSHRDHANELYEQAYQLEQAAEQFGRGEISPARMLAEWAKARTLFHKVTGTPYMA